MKPYHLFRRGGTSFVYHATAGRFIRVDPAAYEYLRLRSDLPKADAEREFSAAFPDRKDVLADCAKLETEGFFDEAPTSLPDDAVFNAEYDRRFNGTCNNLVLSVSSGCNLACRYCYCGVCRDELPDAGLMSEATAMDALEKFLAAADTGKGIRVTFFGGEPLLNKNVIRRAVERCNAWAAEHGVRAGYSITTNATLIDEEIAKLIAENNFGLLVSLDGPRELHDRQCPMRSGEGSYEQAAAGIRRLMKFRRKVTVRCTMAHPAPDAMKLIRFFKDFGFTRIILGTVSNPTFPSALDFTDDDHRAFELATENEIIPWMLEERKSGREPAYDPFDEIDAFQCERAHGDTAPALRCGACHGARAVAPDGTVYPCHRFVGMKAWAIGSVENGIDEAKCRDFWLRHRAASKTACESCWAHRICGGPCPWEIARSDGTFTAPDRICRETKTWIEQGAFYMNAAGEAGLDKEQGEKK